MLNYVFSTSVLRSYKADLVTKGINESLPSPLTLSVYVVMMNPLLSTVLAVHFSDVAVLLAFILLPSTIITLALLGRMCCPPRDKSQTQGYHSPIEVTPG